MSESAREREGESAMERERDLPEGWESANLREILNIEYGEGLTESERDSTGDIPVYGSSGIVGNHNQALINGPCIIVGRKGSAGEVHYSQSPCWPIDTTYYLQPPSPLPTLYVYYALRSLDLEFLDKSTTIPSLSRDDFYAQCMPIAPLPEQRRIVKAIETQFTRLDAAVTALERARANLERYRASVLQAACEGRLVPTEAELAREQGRDYEPADKLLERILEERRARWEEERWEYEIERAKKKAAQAERKAAGLPYYIRELPRESWIERTEEEYAPYLPKGDKWKKKYDEPEPPDTEGLSELPEGWCWARVEQVTVMSQYGTSDKASFDHSGIPVLRMGNIEDGELNFDDLKYMPADWPDVSKFLLQDGDVLFNRTNSAKLVGKTAVYKEHHPRSVFASYLVRFQTSDYCLSDYLSFYINSSWGREYIASVVSQQVGQANVNATKMSKMTIFLPPLAEQRRIADEVERRLSVVDALEQAVEANLTRARRLRQAILKKAFEGRLVPQDPSDEPASALLERIHQT